MSDKKNHHPFLKEDFYIKWSELTADKVEEDISLCLKKAENEIKEIIKIDLKDSNFENTFVKLEKIINNFQKSWGKVSHLFSVCESKELRSAYQNMNPQVSEFFTNIPLNKQLWERLFHVFNSNEFSNNKKYSKGDKRLALEIIDWFKKKGAGLDDQKKEKLLLYIKEIAKLTQSFSSNVLDSRNQWNLIIEDENKIKGLPNNIKDSIRFKDKDDNKDKWKITLDFPVYAPVMQYVDDENIRKKVWEGYQQIGLVEKFDNTKIVLQVLDLRQKVAELLGKENFAQFATEKNMLNSDEKALSFIKNLHKKSKPHFNKEIENLLKFKNHKSGDKNQTRTFNPWDFSYWSEKYQLDQLDYNDEMSRPYFEIGSIIDGLFKITKDLYGIEIVEKSTCFGSNESKLSEDTEQVWHPEVKLYDVFDSNLLKEFDKEVAHIGSFYTDWHPRKEKRGGAWMNPLIMGTYKNNKRVKHLGIICGNMTPGSDNNPSLLTHNEVCTIFHEFGHLLHQLLSEVPYSYLAGTDVAIDFVELPSQFMENFCWERKTLDIFAKHYQTGEVIPDDLYKKMLKSRNFMVATGIMRQLSFGKMDLELHINQKKLDFTNLDDTVESITEGYTIKYSRKVKSVIRSFSHLFSSFVGYAAGYYCYKWSEVLEADVFLKFKENGVLSKKIGSLFRKEILSQGNMDDPDKLFRNFMGRDPDLSTLLKKYEIE